MTDVWKRFNLSAEGAAFKLIYFNQLPRTLE